MIKAFYTFIFLFFIIESASSQAKDTIFWSTHYKLNWRDFEGQPDTTLQYEALTYSGIQCKYSLTDSSFKYEVKAYFLKTRSWRMPYSGQVALDHEQLHFDICELFARKLRRELSKLKPSRQVVKQQVDDLYARISAEKEKMQEMYDERTDFGRNLLMQKKWRTGFQVTLAAYNTKGP